MNKKSMVFWMFIEIIIGVLAAYLLTSVALNYGEQNIFLKTKLARDIAIEVNTLYAVPGNIYLQYPQNLSDYRVEFDENVNIVKVYQSIDPIPPSYNYVGEHIDYLKEYKKDFLEINKDKNKISFKE